MKISPCSGLSLSLAVCLGMLLSQSVLAEQPAKPQANQTLEVSLHDGGLLLGQVVNPQGKAKPGVTVSLQHQGRELARTTTDQLGRFAVKGLNGGAYHLATAGSRMSVRAWTKPTAPPEVAIGALLVDGITVRGQCHSGCHGCQSCQGAASGACYDDGTVYTDGSAGYYDGNCNSACSSGNCGHDHCGGGLFGGGGLLGLGLLGGGGGGGVLASSPWLIGAGVAAAIAIPVALDDDDAS